jgi:hypothetical protein
VILVDNRPEIRRSLAEGKIACEAFVREDNERLARGQAVHRFIYRWTAFAEGGGREPDREEARELAAGAWADTQGLDPFDFEDFMQLCERYAQSHLARLDTLVGYEQTLKLDVGWAVLTCTYDRLDRHEDDDPDDPLRRAMLWDYKTEHRRMNHEFQKRWYAQMLFLAIPTLEHLWWQEDPLRSGSLPDPERVERGQYDDWWEATLTALRQRVLEPTGERVGSHICFDCGNRLDCARAIKPATIVPRSEEQAVLLVREHRRLTAGADARWEALARWANGKQPLHVDGEFVGWMTPIEERFVVTATDEEVLDFLGHTPGFEPENLERFANRSTLIVTRGLLSNPGSRQALVNQGLAKFVLGEAEMKARKTPPKDAKQ